MMSPMASHTNSRSQFAAGSENISIKQQRIPMTGTKGTQGQRKGRSAFGYFRRMIRTAVQTMVKANSVPMLVRSSRASRGRKPARTMTNAPMSIVDFHGVRNLGWQSATKHFDANL